MRWKTHKEQYIKPEFSSKNTNALNFEVNVEANGKEDTKHDISKDLCCLICRRRYHTKSGMRTHVDKMHPDQSKWLMSSY